MYEENVKLENDDIFRDAMLDNSIAFEWPIKPIKDLYHSKRIISKKAYLALKKKFDAL